MATFAGSGPGSTRPGTGPPAWREVLAPYARPTRPSLIGLASSVLPYLALSMLIYLALGVSYLLVLALAVPTAAFLVRVFIVFHDCSHGYFAPVQARECWLGDILGLLVFAPFVCWRHDMPSITPRRGIWSAGDRRRAHADGGEYQGLTGGAAWATARFEFRSWCPGWGRSLGYVIGPRIVPRGARPRMRRSVLGTDVALVVILGALAWAIGWRELLLVAGPTGLMAGAVGMWLFYVQHQFENAYWQSAHEWTYTGPRCAEARM